MFVEQVDIKRRSEIQNRGTLYVRYGSEADLPLQISNHGA